MTARQWQSKNDWKQWNMRDYATIEQLIPNRFRNLELFHYVQNSSF
jgi:hypothetical protein